MKKYGKLLLVMVLAFSTLLAACGGKNEDNQGADGGAEGGTKTIKIFQFKVEIAEALNKLKAEYEKSIPALSWTFKRLAAARIMARR